MIFSAIVFWCLLVFVGCSTYEWNDPEDCEQGHNMTFFLWGS